MNLEVMRFVHFKLGLVLGKLPALMLLLPLALAADSPPFITMQPLSQGVTPGGSNYLETVTHKAAVFAVVPGFTRILNDVAASGTGGTGVAWGDFDGDGKVDLLVAADKNLLYKNQGGGFVLVTNSITLRNLGVRTANWGGIAWGDYDNDGRLDLFESTGDGNANYLYHNEGGGVFTSFNSAPFRKNNLVSLGCAWGDYDNDGYIDLFVATRSPSSGGANDQLFHNNGDGTFTAVTNSVVVSDNANSQSGVWQDFDNDGYLDLFVAVVNGARNLLYKNNGNGSFTKITNSVIAKEGGDCFGAAWGDYDNDGLPDLFVAGVRNYFYHNEGNGNFTKLTNAFVVNDPAGSVAGCAWADFDNDGWLDLLITGSRNYLYHNNADGTFSKVNAGSLTTDATTGGVGGGAWADFDNDGFPDLVIPNYSGRNYLYRNNGNSNNWISIKCEGRVSNRSAIGAKVRIKAALQGRSRWQLREISGGGNYFAQNDLRAQFGLADATNVEVVRVEWPSGIVQELDNVAPKQFLTIREPARLAASTGPAKGVFQFTLSGGKGLDYLVETSVDLTRWSPFQAVTNLTGVLQITAPVAASPSPSFYRAKEQ